MRLSDIQNKDVIDLLTGIKIGNIIDLVISESGEIVSIILERKKLGRFISQGEELEIKFNQIKKIGKDVILVETILK